MNLAAKLKHELKAVALATLFFGAWIGALILLKTLVLEEYAVSFTGWSKVLAGALILGKVALILENVPLGTRVQSAPAGVDVVLRTVLYSAGVFLVLVLEHGLRECQEQGGFIAAITEGFRQAKFPHVLANTLCLSGALLVYNLLTLVRRHLGAGGLARLLLDVPVRENQRDHPPNTTA
jgi:hypothetical protein